MLTTLQIRSEKRVAGSRQEATLRNGASTATIVQLAEAHEPGIGFLCISTRSESTFDRIVIGVAGHVPQSNQGNQYFLNAVGDFTNLAEACYFPNQEA